MSKITLGHQKRPAPIIDKITIDSPAVSGSAIVTKPVFDEISNKYNDGERGATGCLDLLCENLRELRSIGSDL